MKVKPVILPVVLLAACLFIACQDAVDSQLSADLKTGITDDAIVIGSSLALGGHAGYLGTQTLHGAMAYLKHINAAGGINGRRIRLVTYDDGYDPPQCLVNTQRLLIEDRVFSLFCYVGTPTTVRVLPLIEDARIPLVGMFTGANALREPLNRYLINVRASYYQETAAAVRYLVEQLNIRDIAVFYQYDAYGFDGLRGTELALKEFSLVPVSKGSYVRGTLDVEEGLDRIRASGARSVVMIGTYEPCAKFIRMARANGYHPVFYNVSFVGADALARLLGAEGEGVIVSQVVPPPEYIGSEKRLWGVKEYVDLLATYFPDDRPNFVGLEGYINARVLVEGLKRAGRNLDRESFIRAIESIRDYDLGIANTLSFSPQDHQGLERVYFTRISGGGFVLIKD
ncbi:MAG: ABC transporter substrate-binding protein [Desulfosarcina sp.]|nr:ABC transporter substrate-binding protein [Desulfosarcina sp.]MBC2743245.1 ABC transporter substrate-binding protein [Desulfosarcina sp.]MBC2766156.1 ABC transporter substrate-binding protein [Desulfosarcina sp.]